MLDELFAFRAQAGVVRIGCLLVDDCLHHAVEERFFGVVLQVEHLCLSNDQ